MVCNRNLPILGPLLFDIHLCDLFFEDYIPDFANFADNTTSYECGPTLKDTVMQTEKRLI